METKTLADRYILKKILKSENIEEVKETARINLEILQAIRVYEEKNCPVDVFLKHLAEGDIDGAFTATSKGKKNRIKSGLKMNGNKARLRFNMQFIIRMKRSLNKMFMSMFINYPQAKSSDIISRSSENPEVNTEKGFEVLLKMNQELTTSLLKRTKAS